MSNYNEKLVRDFTEKLWKKYERQNRTFQNARRTIWKAVKVSLILFFTGLILYFLMSKVFKLSIIPSSPSDRSWRRNLLYYFSLLSIIVAGISIVTAELKRTIENYITIIHEQIDNLYSFAKNPQNHIPNQLLEEFKTLEAIILQLIFQFEKELKNNIEIYDQMQRRLRRLSVIVILFLLTGIILGVLLTISFNSKGNSITTESVLGIRIIELIISIQTASIITWMLYTGICIPFRISYRKPLKVKNFIDDIIDLLYVKRDGILPHQHRYTDNGQEKL